MTRLAFDLETDGLLRDVTKVHCIVITDVDTGVSSLFDPTNIEGALEPLYNADEIIGHNIIGYDLPVLKKLFNWRPRPGCRITDTMVCARLMRPNMKEDDHKGGIFLGKLTGNHSLRAWGMRLGCHKGDYEGGWEVFSQEMLDYCVQDVAVTIRILNYLKPWEYPPFPLALEYRKAWVCAHIEQMGWPFDAKKAGVLAGVLVERKDILEKHLCEKFGTWQEVDKVFIPKRDNKTRGYFKNVPVTKYKTVVFNPGSRVHIQKKLMELGWLPEEFTESGRAKLDEDILERIAIPEAKMLVEYLLVEKRLGQLQDGDQAWLKVVASDGRIHGSINPCGTVTGRCTHYSPNVSQVPAVRALYGRESRELFVCPPGWKLVSADQSGLELRTLAHYLHFFDKGEYAKVILEGDVHTFNQTAAGLPDRDMAKTFIYAWLYGAGDEKIGKIVKGNKARGKKLKETFLEKVPAIGKLKKQVSSACKRGYLKGLDGRRLHIRSDHSALNTLLQGAGAAICGEWVCSVYEELCSRYKPGDDFQIVGWVHDDMTIACPPDLASDIGETMVRLAKRAGDKFDFKVRLDAGKPGQEYSVGSNWAEVH